MVVIAPSSICALIAARNERPYLQVLLPRLAAQGIDVAILDHGSSDGSHALYEQLRGAPVVAVEPLADTGVFSLSAQMLAKQQLAACLPHRWLVHHDADELLHHRDGRSSLRQCIEEAEGEGANALNFEEFVFLPEPGSQQPSANHIEQHRLYYYFLKGENRLNRAFRRELNGCNAASGGHVLGGEGVQLARTTHVLRHYIALSEAHIQLKYATRRFCPEELAAGWHRKRLAIPPEQLRIPARSPYLFTLPAADHPELNRSCPAHEHYWLWSAGERQP